MNDAYTRDLFELWKKKGVQILEQVAREQPAVLVKCMTLMMPKEVKVESVHSVIGGLPDEQLHAMVHELQERIAAKLSGEDAKVINADAETEPALPSPDQPAGGPWNEPGLRKRNPKSKPETLAKAREYMRQRRAAARAAKAKIDMSDTKQPQAPDCTENEQSLPSSGEEPLK